MCLSVTTVTKKIVDGFVPNFMGRNFLGEREDQFVSLRSVEVCGSNGQKTPQTAVIYISYLPSDKNPQISLSWGVVLS